MVDQKKIMLDLSKKWVALPLGIFITLFAGSALNLIDRFGVLSNLAEPWVQQLVIVSIV